MVRCYKERMLQDLLEVHVMQSFTMVLVLYMLMCC